ncbi:cytochrome c oxidase assembly protein [Bacillus sp. EB600]|uniref:cytochrome c oxidase assembly protein n=1 Tax=Bacillus sp. EB600 TaxID=2806345 RepID=UPI00210F1E73|nr:cytochrome c oxidase assembly protein [Bacillus sp. EB600]MCQ6281627.1 cytochrome c oxidase assembly protein [Bacillus sp. EB600]
MGRLAIFGFQALWSPYLLATLIFITAGYFLITVKFRYRFKNSKPLTSKQAFRFLTGITLLYVVKGSPIDLMSHLVFYAHMIQSAVLYLVIPPLFITGIPGWSW